MDKLGNGGKGIAWNTEDEVKGLAALNRTVKDGPAKSRPRIETDIDAAETVLYLAPETNGQVAVKAWAADRKSTRLNSSHVASSYAVYCLKKKKKQYTD